MLIKPRYHRETIKFDKPYVIKDHHPLLLKQPTHSDRVSVPQAHIATCRSNSAHLQRVHFSPPFTLTRRISPVFYIHYIFHNIKQSTFLSFWGHPIVWQKLVNSLSLDAFIHHRHCYLSSYLNDFEGLIYFHTHVLTAYLCINSLCIDVMD